MGNRNSERASCCLYYLNYLQGEGSQVFHFGIINKLKRLKLNKQCKFLGYLRREINSTLDCPDIFSEKSLTL